MDREHIAMISRRAKLIKLADRADNLREGAGSPDRAWLATCAKESQLLADVLRGTHPVLEGELAAAIINAARIAAGA